MAVLLEVLVQRYREYDLTLSPDVSDILDVQLDGNVVNGHQFGQFERVRAPRGDEISDTTRGRPAWWGIGAKLVVYAGNVGLSRGKCVVFGRILYGY